MMQSCPCSDQFLSAAAPVVALYTAAHIILQCLMRDPSIHAGGAF